jgi:hypothetical integral membrane protein (TIGR02206 family)
MLEFFKPYELFKDFTNPVGLFSTTHLLTLLIFVVLGIVILVIGKRLATHQQHQLALTMAWTIMGLEVIRIIWRIWVGALFIDYHLPLHLCGIISLTMPIIIMTKKPLWYEFTYSAGMLGAMMALLTPDCTMYPWLHFQYLQSMTIHFLIFLMPWYLIVVEGFRPKLTNLKYVVGILLAMMIPIGIIDWLLDANYFFLCHGTQGTLVETLEKLMGWPMYLLGLLGIAIVLWVLAYLPWEGYYWFKNKRAKINQ